jgi:hypothetical protein
MAKHGIGSRIQRLFALSGKLQRVRAIGIAVLCAVIAMPIVLQDRSDAQVAGDPIPTITLPGLSLLGGQGPGAPQVFAISESQTSFSIVVSPPQPARRISTSRANVADINAAVVGFDFIGVETAATNLVSEIRVSLLPDDFPENNETFSVIWSDGPRVVSKTVMIRDDDVALARGPGSAPVLKRSTDGALECFGGSSETVLTPADTTVTPWWTTSNDSRSLVRSIAISTADRTLLYTMPSMAGFGPIFSNGPDQWINERVGTVQSVRLCLAPKAPTIRFDTTPLVVTTTEGADVSEAATSLTVRLDPPQLPSSIFTSARTSVGLVPFQGSTAATTPIGELTLRLLPDNIPETGEDFTINWISGARSVQATVNIVDDDAPGFTRGARLNVIPEASVCSPGTIADVRDFPRDSAKIPVAVFLQTAIGNEWWSTPGDARARVRKIVLWRTSGQGEGSPVGDVYDTPNGLTGTEGIFDPLGPDSWVPTERVTRIVLCFAAAAATTTTTPTSTIATTPSTTTAAPSTTTAAPSTTAPTTTTATTTSTAAINSTTVTLPTTSTSPSTTRKLNPSATTSSVVPKAQPIAAAPTTTVPTFVQPAAAVEAGTQASLRVTPTETDAPGSVLADGRSSSIPKSRRLLEWAIDFGDGTIENGIGASPGAEHTYLKPGVYTVTLAITDDRRARSTDSKTVTVRGRRFEPIAGLEQKVCGGKVRL